jgi:hypothetical protein
MPAKESSTPKKSEDQPIKNGKTCFTIMPYGGWFDNYYEIIYKPAIEDAGCIPYRADDIYRPGTIVHDIWNYTKKANILLADLTGKNPNVFYELGLAHALAKPVILVTESIEDIPFDLRALRIIEYDKNSPDWGLHLKEKITASILEIMESPLEAVLPAFLTVTDYKHDISVSKHEKEIIEIKQELGMLRRQIITVRRPRESRMDPSLAHERIIEYHQAGMPAPLIIERLSNLGVPEDWIKDQLNEIDLLYFNNKIS